MGVSTLSGRTLPLLGVHTSARCTRLHRRSPRSWSCPPSSATILSTSPASTASTTWGQGSSLVPACYHGLSAPAFVLLECASRAPWSRSAHPDSTWQSTTVPIATSCWGSTKGGKEEQRHEKVLEDLVNGKHELERKKKKTPKVWWKVIKVDQKCSSLQSGQQIVFAARTLASWQLWVFGKEQDIK